MAESSKKGNTRTWFAIIVIALVLVLVALVVYFLTRGETVQNTGDIKNEPSVALVCTADDIDYMFTTYNEARSKQITVNMMFGGGELSSISLTYQLNYDNLANAKRSEATNHASMNSSMAKYGLSEEKLNVNYTYSERYFRMSIYVSGSDFDAHTARFFMLNETSKTQESLKSGFEQQGFKCMEKDN